MEWTQIGPAPLEIDAEQNYQGNGPDSGEVADIAIDPRGGTDKVIFVATESGGMWQSTDGGQTWTTTFDHNASLSMGAVVLDPANPSIVYAGTGNPTNTGFFKGVGVYKSTDDGQTWTLTPMSAGFGGVSIVRMVMPATNVLVVGTQGGVTVSTDGGGSFTIPTINGVTNSQINDLHLDPATPTTIYASVKGAGIFRSTNSGATWGPNLFSTQNGSPLDNTTNPNFTPGFISFAQTKTPNNNTIYASVQNVNASAANPKWGLFVYSNSSALWTKAAGGGNPSNNCGQCGYDQTIGVDPLDGTVVYLGFVDMWASTNSGGSFSEIGHNQVHNDHHALTFSPHLAGATAGQVPFWDGSDGGVALATSQGGTFTAANGPIPGAGTAIASNLFRNIDIGRGSTSNAKYTYGGMQDTGTGTFNGNSDTPTTWHLHIDGDGAGVAVDPCNPAHAVIMDDGCLQVTTDGGGSYNGASLAGGSNPGGPGFSFGNTFAFDQVCTSGTDNTVFAAVVNYATAPSPGQGCFGSGTQTYSLYRSTNGGSNYSSVANGLTQQVNAIATVKIDPNLVWIGLSDGNLQLSTNAQAGSPTFAAPAAQPPQAGVDPVTAVAIDPNNTQNVVVTYAGTCGATCNNNPNKHVYMTSNGGASWTDIGGTVGGGLNNLPDLPVNAVVIDPNTQPHTIIVGNDAGVLETVDQGNTWQVLGLGMPNVDVVALALDPSVTPEVLRAGTFGRSTFELDAPTTGLISITSNLNFGSVCKGSASSAKLQIFNVGTEDLHISSFKLISGSSDFSIIAGPATPVTIPAGEEIEYTIGFNPTGNGSESAVFRINSDDPNTPVLTLTASGTVGSGKIVLTGNTSFGDTCAGSSQQPITVANVGTCDLHVTSATTCSDFTIENNPFPATISHDFSLPLTIEFTPTTPGPKNCTLTVSSDDPNNHTATLPLSANAPAANLNIPPSLAFPPTVVQNLGACTSRLPFPISNDGQCPVTIDSVVVGGTNAADYSLLGLPSTPITIEAGHILGEGDLNAVFAPLTPLSRTDLGSITVTYHDATTSSTIAPASPMCGEGVETGIRVLVTVGGVPVSQVYRMVLSGQVSPVAPADITAAAKKAKAPPKPKKIKYKKLDTQYFLNLQTVPAGPAPCPQIQYHREYGTVSNPIQLQTGSYQLTVSIVNSGGHLVNQTINFDLNTCDFNKNILVQY